MIIFDKTLLPSHCGFRKGHSSQHCLLAILEKQTNLEHYKPIFPKHLTVLIINF